ncbi:WcbI family polysaccharide biosynthesis putative acetyltransferase [Arsenicicoccus dermatophilus]|uniref:WcbI family polysaccharide biosynthesis putative acetyltransferase n=1 Tax=Arsenicicoccus dermatophilus TaxID=1076331 RepID=UPI001F4CCD0F|nr:WcbI family polysaccharide biosynthesis putative acetyltransferase [Arsenicicoccus dermatophilus]
MSDDSAQAPLTDQPAPGSARPVDAVDGRRLHYGEFYGERELVANDRPVVAVVGNCQAESIRVLLAEAPSQAVQAVRVPPIFELEQDDLPHLRSLLARADVLVAQPVRDDYRGMPLGTAQLASWVPGGAQVVLFPSYRYNGLYPWQVEARSPYGDPPVVPYLDLRTLVTAATGERPGHLVPAEGVREIARASVELLRSKEQEHDTVVASDLIEGAGVDAAHVVNHPGNTVLVGIARRLQQAIGLPVDAGDPGRTLLREIFAPLDEEVLAALGMDAEPRPTWTHRGEPLAPEVVHEAHLAWLREHPDVVDATMDRHQATLQSLGLV